MKGSVNRWEVGWEGAAVESAAGMNMRMRDQDDRDSRAKCPSRG